MIQKATPEMAPELTAVAYAAKRHWGYPESYMQIWQDDLTLTAKYIRENTIHYAAIDGKIGGFYALAEIDTGWEIDHFWILPTCMSKGIGRQLFSHAVHQLQKMNVSELFVLSDPYAEGFYEKMGAVRIEMKDSAIPGRQLPWMRVAL